jgi:RNA polymerase sigma factor (sigma-70 family)
VTPLLAQRPRADRAFERLYKKHVHAVYRYTLAVLHNEADAEDVTQTTFLSAYRAFQRGERPERAHNWLIKIAHNACRQRFRDSSRRPQEVAFDESLAAATPDNADVPTATEIRRALGFLGFNQRAALVMRELEGRSYAEIAQMLDVSVGAVETLLFRARRALREQLEGGLTCREAELTLSRLDEHKLSSSERGSLRAHLRECKDCAVLERRSRAQRAAIKGLGAIPLPPSLGTFFGTGAVGGGTAATGAGLGAKIAVTLAAGAIAGGLGNEALKAVAAKNPASRTEPASLVQGREFSAVSALTGGRLATNPLVAANTGSQARRRRSGRPAHGSTSGVQHPGAGSGSGSSSAAAQQTSAAPRRGAGGIVEKTITPLLPKVPPPLELPPPPEVPELPIELPPLPPLPPPPVQLPPPPVQLPPPPPLP